MEQRSEDWAARKKGSKACAADFPGCTAGLLWDRIGHVAVVYYGAVFAVVGSIGLLLLIPGKHDRRNAGATK